MDTLPKQTKHNKRQNNTTESNKKSLNNEGRDMVSSGGCNSATEAGDCDTTVTAVGERPDESHLLDNNAVIVSVLDDADT